MSELRERPKYEDGPKGKKVRVKCPQCGHETMAFWKPRPVQGVGWSR